MKNVVKLLALVSFLGLMSCEFEAYQPTVTGSCYELLVVGQEKVWRDSVGIKLSELLQEDMPGLAQPESYFSPVSYTTPEQFTGIFKPVRNILIYDVAPEKYTQGKISFTRDVWAKTQAVIKITAPNEEEFEKTYLDNIDKIRSFYINAEAERSFDFFKKHKNSAFMDSVKKKFGANIVIPNHLTLDNYGKDFCWFSNGNINLRQDIIVYRVPYTSKEDFNAERILAVRDSVLKENIPGPEEGSYMTTEYRYIPPISRAVKSKEGKYSMEIRGLWRVEGDCMGGPFVSRTYVDKDNAYLVTTEAFMYAPNQKKRTAYRQLEAMINNVTFE